MFRVVTPVIVYPTAEARQALGAQLRPAGLAAWRHIARQGKGLEFAYLGFHHGATCLALCSRLRAEGFIVIEIGLGSEPLAARTITAAAYRGAARRMFAAGGRP
jgi:hypothetical protein